MSTFTPNLNLEKPDGTDYVNIGALNSNMDKLDAKIPSDIADYPIEIGTKDGWNYIKWKSGVANCWLYRDHIENAETHADGAVFTSRDIIIDYPITFTGIPKVNLNVHPDTNYPIGAFVNAHINDVKFNPFFHMQMGRGYIGVSIDVKGRWK